MRLSKLFRSTTILVLVLSLSIYLSANFWFTLVLQGAIATEIGLPVNITGLDFRPWQGVIKFDRLQLQNPPGFSSPYLLALDGLDALIIPASLRQTVVELDHISLAKLEIYLEQGLSFNLLPVINHLSRKNDRVDQGQPLAAETKVKARLIEIKAATVHTILPFWQRSLDLARFKQRDLNSSEGDGVRVSWLLSQILFQLLRPVVQQNLLELPQTALIFLTEAIAKLEN